MRYFKHLTAALVALCLLFACRAMAQPPHSHYHPPYQQHPVNRYPDHHRYAAYPARSIPYDHCYNHSQDILSAELIRMVRDVAIANQLSAAKRPIVVATPSHVSRPISSTNSIGTYSPGLGASFRIEPMQIPGYQFTGARLMSDPVTGSPLQKIGLRRGDVITRVGDKHIDSHAELNPHTGFTSIRYIKTGTSQVVIDTIFIAVDQRTETKTHYAP